MRWQLALAWIVACAGPGLLGGLLGGLFGHDRAMEAGLAIAMVSIVAGPIMTAPVAIPLILLAQATNCFKWWSCILGGALTGLLYIVMVTMFRSKGHFADPAEFLHNGTWLFMVLVGAIAGAAFKLVLKVTGYDNDYPQPFY
jgi:hypothetical protein